MFCDSCPLLVSQSQTYTLHFLEDETVGLSCRQLLLTRKIMGKMMERPM